MNAVSGSSLLSIVTPAFNEARNLPALYERIRSVMEQAGHEWEWIVVDDHSRDDTFQVVARIAQQDPRVKVLRFSRNFGAHGAIACGIHHAAGDFCVALAGDLQDPPEVIPALVREWEAGAQVVWATRASRAGETRRTLLFARIYYWLMRTVVGIDNMPASGADFFLLDRKAMEAFSGFREQNASVLALLCWMGFRQAYVEYDKQARLHGTSGWSFGKKIKLVLDSVTAFSYLPIRAMSVLGMVTAFLGFLYAIFIFFNAVFLGRPVEGWASIMLAILILGGLQMLMFGVLGEYLWRTLEEGKRRPAYLIEDHAGAISPRPAKQTDANS